VKQLDEEDSRAVRESLDEETLAIYDLLKKPELTAAEVKKVKSVAAELLAALKKEKLRIHAWRDKESTRDAVQVEIRNFLWSDETGLPSPSYSEPEVETRIEDVFRHVYRAYPVLPSPIYAAA
jgi:type I restriction enzyme R subunit